MKNVIYQNSALVEVIAEIQWELTPVSTMPNGAVDPFYLALKEQLGGGFRERGYSLVEQLVPPEVPLEFVPWQPLIRFRRSPNEWPLYQLGPGLLTANYAKGYKGWTAFSEFFIDGLRLLIQNFPSADKLLKVKQLKLTYVDLFSHSHRYESFRGFASNLLPISLPFPENYFSEFGKLEALDAKFEVGLPLNEPKNSVGRIVMLPALHEQKPGLMVQFSVSSSSLECDLGLFESWLESSHGVLRRMFENVLSSELREILNPVEL